MEDPNRRHIMMRALEHRIDMLNETRTVTVCMSFGLLLTTIFFECLCVSRSKVWPVLCLFSPLWRSE